MASQFLLYLGSSGIYREWISKFQAHLNAGFDKTFANPMVQRIMSTRNYSHSSFSAIYLRSNYAPLRVAKQFGITLVVDGENGEAEYGGSMKHLINRVSVSLMPMNFGYLDSHWINGNHGA